MKRCDPNKWEEYYKSRQVTADEAVTHIKSGDTVVVGHAAGEPYILNAAMVRNKEAYRDVEIIHCVAMGKCEYCEPENAEYFRHNSWFAGVKSRKAITEGRADFTACYLSQMPDLMRNVIPRLDVFLVQVSPPDKHGYCSLGISVDYGVAAASRASTIIAQVNKNMPRTMGQSFIHVSDMDYFVLDDSPVIELPRPEITEAEMAIGRNCATLINDGDTLQLGIGSLPDAILMFLKDKKDLGIHSEMISDGVMDLMKAGVVNNSKKTLHPGKVVIAFAMGTREFYDFVDDNPAFLFVPGDYGNDPFVIAQNDNMVSINSCVAVDFNGQFSSESAGPKQISGVGGQVDFFTGAMRAKGGRNIMVIRSTTADESTSKIVPYFDEGTIVTTSRCLADYVVTEYGIATLRGKCSRLRGKELIKIAHPKFRDELIAKWEEIFKMKFDDEETV